MSSHCTKAKPPTAEFLKPPKQN